MIALNFRNCTQYTCRLFVLIINFEFKKNDVTYGCKEQPNHGKQSPNNSETCTVLNEDTTYVQGAIETVLIAR